MPESGPNSDASRPNSPEIRLSHLNQGQSSPQRQTQMSTETERLQDEGKFAKNVNQSQNSLSSGLFFWNQDPAERTQSSEQMHLKLLTRQSVPLVIPRRSEPNQVQVSLNTKPAIC